MLIGVAAGSFMVLEAMKPKPKLAEAPPPGLAVFSEEVRRDDLVFSVEAQGEVRPKRQIAVASQIGGRISFVSSDFVDGGFIRRNEVLIRIESADYELGVVRARSGVASAEQRLAREEAEAELARQDLASLGITEGSPLARREPQLEEARAALASAKAQLAAAELSLQRTVIRAPFTGRVREKSVDAGAFISPGQSLGRIFATDVVEVVLPITDIQLGQLGLPLAFEASAGQPGPKVIYQGQVGGEQRRWEGEIKRTSAVINSQTRLINIITELEDPYGRGADNGAPMAPGLFVNATIIGAVVPDLLVAPRAAIRGGSNFYRGNRDTGQLEIVDVDIVFTDPDGAWFRSDQVQAGDLSIISPIQAAVNGMKITLLQRMSDGSVVTHSASQDNLTDDSALAAGGMVQSPVMGGQ